MDTYAAASTVYHFFNTHKADGTPITLAGTPGIDIYKDNGTTQDADDSGLTLTVDFDSVTGLHLVTIDTSTDGTFYATGHVFNVVLSAGTVDSVSVVGTTVYQFKLGEVPADVAKISGDSTAADNLEDLFEETTAIGNLIDFVDGTGYAGGTIKLATDATLNATQGSYAPAKAGDKMDIVDAPTATGLAAIADAILTRSFASVSYTGTVRCLLTAAQALRNKFTAAAGAGGYSVKKEDDSTESWAGTLTIDGDGNITAMDPDS